MRVPADIAVTGFDDIPIARFLTPPLTTVGVRIAGLGEQAIQRLLAHIDEGNGQPRRHEILTTTLVVRGSCGGVPAARPGAPDPRERNDLEDFHSRR